MRLAGDHMPTGVYRMDFETAAYMARCHSEHPAFFAPQPFYPRVHVHFQIALGQVCTARRHADYACCSASPASTHGMSFP